MRRFISKRAKPFDFNVFYPKSYLLPVQFVVILGLTATVMMTGCDRVKDEYYEGQGQAERDLAKGELKIAVVDGATVPAFWDYTDLLRKRYRIGWCIHSLPANPRAAEAWVRGYNEVSLPKIERQFGTNILKQTLADAQKLNGQ
jgi:hypothetical protein